MVPDWCRGGAEAVRNGAVLVLGLLGCWVVYVQWNGIASSVWCDDFEVQAGPGWEAFGLVINTSAIAWCGTAGSLCGELLSVV